MNTPLRNRLVALAALAVLVLGVAVLALDVFHVLDVDLPAAQVVDAGRHDNLLEHQGWATGWGISPLNQAEWFHHASQGTIILPYDWFISLDRPELTLLTATKRIAEGDYLQRFGFLPSARHEKMNPDGLPIGFATTEKFQDPTHPKVPAYRAVGLTCAACHTGEVHYKDADGTLRAARVEGAPAMINIAQFQKAIGLALVYTDKFDSRFDRFADRVLGQRKGDTVERQTLRNDLRSFIKAKMAERSYAERKGLNSLELGFARTDALGLIGNRVFGTLDDENLTVVDAPVNFPHLWDTPWFDWVQYNASIRMPMVRNIGEALGVGAVVNLRESDHTKWYASTVDVENLHRMETQLGGEQPFQGLRPPRWTDTRLPEIDPLKSGRGERLYRQFCMKCHLPPLRELQADLAREKPTHWTTESRRGGTKYQVLALKTYDLQQIGTDPNQALNFYRRLADVGGNTVSAAKGLYNVTGFIRQKFYNDNHFDKTKRFRFDRFREFADATIARGEYDLTDEGVIAESIVPRLAYKARPLNGIWATAPFFHNGSVPNLYEVLLPAAERSKSFYLGTKMFDPVRVGFLTGKFPGGSRLDTSLGGNHNTGHEFRNLTVEELEKLQGLKPPSPLKADDDARLAIALGLAPADWQKLSNDEKARKVWERTWAWIRERDFVEKGLVGPALTETERWDLVEYLKSL